MSSLRSTYKQGIAFNYENGVYITKLSGRKATDLFMSKAEVQASSERIMTCCNIGTPISSECLDMPWEDIPTPYIDKTLDLYFGDPDVVKWIYIVFGRLLYKSSWLDKWHITPIIIQNKDASKFNILLKILQKYLFIPKYMAWVTNETTSSELIEYENRGRKMLLVGQNLDENMRINQSAFESMTGSIKMDEVNYWSLPSILFGEKVPFHYNESSTKRLLVFKLKNYKPIDGIALRNEVGLFIVKCNRAYLEQLTKYKYRMSFVKIIPDQLLIKPTRDLTVTPIYQLLDSQLLNFKKDAKCKVTDFYFCLRQYCTEMELSCPNSDGNFIGRVLECYKEKHAINTLYIKSSTQMENGKPVNTGYIFGIEL